VLGGLISCGGEDSLLLIALTKNHKLFVFTIVGMLVLVVMVVMVMMVMMVVMVMMSSIIMVVVMNVLRIVIHGMIFWYSE